MRTQRSAYAFARGPRYTGRQVWNRQFTDHREAVPGDKRSSLGPVRVWNPRADWVVSAELTHPALVSDQDFLTAQQITALALPEDGRARRYALTGLLICQACGRRLEGHWVNQRPGYRCRHGHTSAHPPTVDAPRWVYWSQGRLIRQLLATRPEVAEFGDAEALASYLRASDAVIVCGTGTLTIEGATLEDTDAATDPVEVTQVQLELPLPSGTGRRRGRTKTRNRKGRIPASARKGRNPRSGHT